MRPPLLVILIIVSGCLAQTPKTGPCLAYKDSDQRDYCLTSDALSSNSMEVCSRIAKPDLMYGCFAAVTGNISLCGSVEDQHWRDQCLYDVAKKAGSLEYCRNISDIQYRSSCLRDTNPKNMILSGCEGIGDYNESLWCYATYSRDLLECSRINDSYWRDLCEKDVDLQMGPPTSTQPASTAETVLIPGASAANETPHAGAATADMSACQEIENPVEKDWCVSDAGIRAKNASLCLQVYNPYWREACFRDTAAVTGDPALCEEITEGQRKDACYLQVSAATGNKTICNRITDHLSRGLCQGQPEKKAY